MAPFNQITIVGLGLIGGSLGMAIRKKHLARCVVGLSRHAATLRKAKRRGAIDCGRSDEREAVREADLVVLATPVDAIVPQALRLSRSMRPGAILTDVGSTKSSIVRALERALPANAAFVGAHPIAGSEQRGIDAADVHLFEEALCILTPTARTNPRALQAVRRLWRGVAERVIFMSPRDHDRLLAATSHLPHLLASCLVRSADLARVARLPRSFLDMTRIAKSDPGLWDGIFLTNRSSLLAAMDRFDREWRQLRRALLRSDRAALRRNLRRSQSLRHALPDP